MKTLLAKHLLIIISLLLFFCGCGGNHSHDAHNHEEHSHAEEAHSDEEVTHFTVYTDSLEIYIVGNPFIANQDVELAVHLTHLVSYKPFQVDSMILTAKVNGNSYRLKNNSGKQGIFTIPARFNGHGIAYAHLELWLNGKSIPVDLGRFTIYHCEHDWSEVHQHNELGNAIRFSKEKAWAVDFSVAKIEHEPMAQIVKTAGRVMPSQQDMVQLVASVSGRVYFDKASLYPGTSVASGQPLLTVSPEGLADDNFAVRFMETKTRYENAKAAYERQKNLADEKVVPAAALERAKGEYEVAAEAYSAMSNSYSTNGYVLVSPGNMEVTDVLVSNGEYVTAGQPLLRLTSGVKFRIECYLQPQQRNLIGSVADATIISRGSGKTVNLTASGGRVAAFGQNTTPNNHLIPLVLEIPASSGITSGEVVEVYLKGAPIKNALRVPLTAIVEEQGNYQVMVQVEPEVFVKREVKLGVTDGVGVQVVSGLKTGERVVTRGAVYVKLAQASGSLDAHSGHVH